MRITIIKRIRINEHFSFMQNYLIFNGLKYEKIYNVQSLNWILFCFKDENYLHAQVNFDIISINYSCQVFKLIKKKKTNLKFTSGSIVTSDCNFGCFCGCGFDDEEIFFELICLILSLLIL